MPTAELITGGIFLATILMVGIAVYADHTNTHKRLDIIAGAIGAKHYKYQVRDDVGGTGYSAHWLVPRHGSRSILRLMLPCSSQFELRISSQAMDQLGKSLSYWENPDATRVIHPTHHIYREAIPGNSRLKLTIKPGWLGSAWVKKKKIVSKSQRN